MKLVHSNVRQEQMHDRRIIVRPKQFREVHRVTLKEMTVHTVQVILNLRMPVKKSKTSLNSI